MSTIYFGQGSAENMHTLLINAEVQGHGGRSQLSGLLRSALYALEGENLSVLSLKADSRGTGITERLRGRIDGITSNTENTVLNVLRENPPDRIFVDGSNLGRLVRLIKRARPELQVITFFHNVEARFFFDAARTAPSPHAFGVLVANTLSERWATRYSDRRVMLNERDARLLGRLYGRTGTDILPMALSDQYYPASATTTRPHASPYALFVGGAFYANVEGMAWYAQKVASQAPIDTIVIGRGMETHKSKLEKWGGVRVVGSVDDLAPWYAHAQAVVAPILSGSGMKTKTAEALMHGKPVVGTPEAFAGYKVPFNKHLKICETPDEFLDALQAAKRPRPEFHPELRALYCSQHSEKALRDRLKEILRKL